MEEEFDENNLWHTHANLLFGFICQECDQTLTYEEFPIGDLDEKFLEFCVGLSNEAQCRGWTCKGDWQFFCPDCSKALKALARI